MSKGRKRRYEKDRAAKQYVLVYVDTYSFEDPPIIISDPMSNEVALQSLERAKKQALPEGFGYFELREVAVTQETKC